jgi:hypothetical protein
VQESNGSVIGFVLSGTGNANSAPTFPPFTRSNNDGIGSSKAAVEVDIIGPVQVTLSTTASVSRLIAPVPDGFVGRGIAVAGATARLRSPVDCTSTLCNVDFQRCETTSLEPCQNDLPETIVLESGRYRFEVQAGSSAASNSSLEIGLASEATASVTLEVTFEEAGCEENGAKVPCECDVTWNNADGGGWGVRANWNPEQVPLDRGDGCDNAIFAFPLPHPVFFDTQAANGLFVRQGAPTFSGERITLTGRTPRGRIAAAGARRGARCVHDLERGNYPSDPRGRGRCGGGVAAANLTLNAAAELIATDTPCRRPGAAGRPAGTGSKDHGGQHDGGRCREHDGVQHYRATRHRRSWGTAGGGARGGVGRRDARCAVVDGRGARGECAGLPGEIDNRGQVARCGTPSRRCSWGRWARASFPCRAAPLPQSATPRWATLAANAARC